MKDPRFEDLARVLVHHSARVQPGDTVLIEAFDIPADFTITLIRAIVGAGGVPLAHTYQEAVRRALHQVASDQQLKLMADVDLRRMQNIQCYIGVRGSFNISEFSDVPREKMDLFERLYLHPVHLEQRVKHTRWVVLRWPLPSMAQSAGMSTEAFEDFYFRVCAGVDYPKMQRAMEPLVELMKRTDKVDIIGPGTDLHFSIKGIGAKACYGERNIPDGECFSTPVRDGVNGVIQFNCETLYRGTVFNNIRLELENGKIVNASTETALNRKLNEILDSDEGGRYCGEWAIGVNNRVRHPMLDTLFDEKIGGSFHLTPGNAYEIADNGNRSRIHWDLVQIQRPDYGGGEIWFDGELLRKNGRFVPADLQELNVGLD